MISPSVDGKKVPARREERVRSERDMEMSKMKYTRDGFRGAKRAGAGGGGAGESAKWDEIMEQDQKMASEKGKAQSSTSDKLGNGRK